MKNLDKSKCHVLRGPLCLYKKLEDMGVEYNKAYISYYDTLNWASYYKNPEFIKDTIHYEYWYANNVVSKDEQSEFGFLILIICLVATVIISTISLILLFCCRKKSSESNTSETDVTLEPDS